MRLVSMIASGFRGFAREVEFDLDADVILLSGPNGTGKTSFFDAILWGLTGAVERIGPNESVVNRFAEFGDARVELSLKSREGSELQIVRRFSGEESLIVSCDGSRTAGAAARSLLLSRLYPNGHASADSLEPFSRSLTRSVYLEQDRVNAFVDTDDEQERFEIVGDLLGAARLSELNRQLDKARKSWTAETNRIRAELRPMLHKRDDLQHRLAGIDSDTDLAELTVACLAWSRSAERLVGDAQIEAPEEDRDPTAWAAKIDGAVRRLSRELRTLDAHSSEVTRMRQALERLPAVTDDPIDAAAAVEQLETRVTEAAADLREAQEAASAARRRQLAQAEESRSLGGMAQLALKHLGESCPVCDQPYDRQATERRLHMLLKHADLPADVPENMVVGKAADDLQELESRLASQRERLRSSEGAARQRDSLKAEIEALGRSVVLAGSIDSDDLSSALNDVEAALDRSAESLRALRTEGERLSVLLVRAVEAEEVATLRNQIADLDVRIMKKQSTCELREQASEDARRLHEAVRKLGESLVEEELHKIEPLLQRIYSTVDPHPAFKVVRFLTAMRYGRGRLWTAIEADSDGESVTVEEPRTVLSSSQLNVLAVAAFLSLNLSIENPTLEVVVLDDPIQSLDNVNLLGLSDLLRRLRGQRQVIVSTHDDRLERLLARKLRPVASNERTLAISLRAWNRAGPIVDVRDIPRDTTGLRLVAA